jgi:hypothetical protein
MLLCRYHQQIVDFHEQIPKEQMLIISDDELRTDAVSMLNRVFMFVGLPPLALERPPTSKELNELIEGEWPGFESSSGWHLASKYVKSL